MSSILGILTSALSLARELLYRLRRPRSTPAQRAERAIHDARAASAQGDAAKVNGQAERDRVRRSLGVMCVLFTLSAAGCGCATIRAILQPDPDATLPDLVPAVVVISADRYQYPMVSTNGVPGWFVPLAVHAEYCEAMAFAAYIRSLTPTHPQTHTPTKDTTP
jgi:hypothetical protein